MKTFIFKRESNNFDDILSDPSIKKYIRRITKWDCHLLISMKFAFPDKLEGYVTIKYGEWFTTLTDRDYTPIPGVDYTPIRR